MQSLTEEIQSFSRTRLKRQCTRVTSLSGRRIIETWKGSMMTVVDDPAAPEKMLGYVPDTSWDLQVGVVKPYLLLGESLRTRLYGLYRNLIFLCVWAGSQDAAHDFSTLRKHKVSHILNVAFGVENVFPDLFVYKTVSILDQPDTDLVPHLQECCDFILQARAEKGVVLVHCNTGISRAPAAVIGYLMSCDDRSFDDALSVVAAARPATCPNPGFLNQLRKYQAEKTAASKH
ncbi:dual specificity protein phosphatase 19a isoform X1 [Nerophis ophidion]|uniref:dual specificity protein phosphatase 19a isoform X1 n=1 Tax=Nerophis ophidion TaxID=159077 RepID=UPI002ADFDD51|nr:dual specificity protein phosphatase 19a isoform X1 [Nerophis ophidion]XP_061735367.1 dual specificity protein phosphatase 19a isoform X1 [Nerophis ophidion]XP_061735368.1 dual specificity protein phosphatase 19a isoform X1 [Nerophis ophidion]XP_061735369.1 dual specificity protein phosphatase 19a isoform X1 [Nerophis ophidion]XP_061735370.1 dual specificity protein phosphatase 19a isoform X1 [Nerophis ophidion]XP_061735371.1 dual specificity protein phosphatase 19a isoform X1 [Nerophis oph